MPLKDKAANVAYRKAFYQANKERLAPGYASHREANREKNRLYQIAYRATHPPAPLEVRRARASAYYQSHKEENRAKAAARRARLRQLENERVLISDLYARDKGICGICRKRVEWEPTNKRMIPSIDHIIPVSKGGGTTYANSRLAHLWCNQSRGNRGHAQPRLLA